MIQTPPQDSDWKDCYECGTAGFIPGMVHFAGHSYHEECYVAPPCSSSQLSQKQLDAFRATPYDFCKEYISKLRATNPIRTVYWITFTLKPDADRDAWFEYLKQLVQWKSVVSFELCFEHRDSNLHAHCKLITNRALNINEKTKKGTKNAKYCFKHHEREYGHVDCAVVRKDNGILKYMQKERDGGNIVYTEPIW